MLYHGALPAGTIHPNSAKMLRKKTDKLSSLSTKYSILGMRRVFDATVNVEVEDKGHDQERPREHVQM